MGKAPIQVIIALLCFTGVLISSVVSISPANSGFDMKGTITAVLSPEKIVVGDIIVNLEGINTTGLYKSTYIYLMEDLKRYYIGKDVLVKGNYAYFDLHGSYNSESINEKIQKYVWDLEVIQMYRTPTKENYSLQYTVIK